MKRVLMFSLLFLAVISMAQAQRNTEGRPSRGQGTQGQGQRMTPAERIDRQTKDLQERLSLNAEQTEKVKAIFTKYSEKQMELFGKMRDANEDERAKLREEGQKIREAQTKEIKALLNDDQKAKYDALLKEQNERMQNRRGGDGNAPPPPPQMRDRQ